MYCCVLVVGHFVRECGWVSREWRTELYVLLCVGSWTFCVGNVRRSVGSGVLNCMYCCMLVVGHFVWEYEGVSREWRTELYVLLCVGSWTFCVGVCVSRELRTELNVLLCVGSWIFCVGV